MQMPMILTNYDQKKNSENKSYSSVFYTSQKGYKMCFCVFANGYWDGKGSRVSVGAHLMKGENDDYLPWPFIGTVTVELLNQLEGKNHHCEDIVFTSDSEASQ